MTAAHLPAYLAHRDAQRKAATRQAVVIAVGDAIEQIEPCRKCGTRLPCEHCDTAAQRTLLALDAAIPHLPDAGIRAVAGALLGPEGAMP